MFAIPPTTYRVVARATQHAPVDEPGGAARAVGARGVLLTSLLEFRWQLAHPDDSCRLRADAIHKGVDVHLSEAANGFQFVRRDDLFVFFCATPHRAISRATPGNSDSWRRYPYGRPRKRMAGVFNLGTYRVWHAGFVAR